ncbi:MAG: Gfo/Idh/MocA family oxidoreductase [Alphaproteobacteria bacterium]|nr:Gfo/Idh/MocA family oxidoreductase [Alphaproteobacteria bacterium]
MDSAELRHIVVIGAGDCASKRLIPALILSGVDPGNIHVFAVEPCAFNEQLEALGVTDLRLYRGDEARADHVVPSLLEDAGSTAKEKGAPVIVASPSFAHLGYVKEFLKAELLVACEKPLTCFPDEVDEFKRLVDGSEEGRSLFCLSYYALEKGLPLTFIANPNMDIPDGLLEVVGANGEKLDQHDLRNIREKLTGPICEAKILLLEGGERSNADDYRGWTVDPEFGGNLIETGIHPVLLAVLSRVIKVEDLAKLQTTEGIFEGYPKGTPSTYVQHSWDDGSINISLLFGKHIHAENIFRGGNIIYKNGMRLDFDFDRKDMAISYNDALIAAIRVSPENQANYVTQVIQFLDFADKGRSYSRNDFALEQLNALSALMKLPKNEQIIYGSDPEEQRKLLVGLYDAPQHRNASRPLRSFPASCEVLKLC